MIIPDGRQTRTLAPVARAKVFVYDELVKVTDVIVFVVVVVITVVKAMERADFAGWSSATRDDSSSVSASSLIIFSSGITLTSILWKNKIKSSVP